MVWRPLLRQMMRDLVAMTVGTALALCGFGVILWRVPPLGTFAFVPFMWVFLAVIRYLDARHTSRGWSAMVLGIVILAGLLLLTFISEHHLPSAGLTVGLVAMATAFAVLDRYALPQKPSPP